MKLFRRYWAILLCTMLCMALALPAAANETNGIDLTEETEGTLTISYTYEDEDGVERALKYVDFEIYFVASISDEDTLVPNEAYQAVDIFPSLEYDQDIVMETRNALEQFINTNPIPSDYTVITNGVGKVVIELPLGLYYISAELFWDDADTDGTISAYYSNPFLVLIDGYYDHETEDYNYDYTAYPKVSTLSLTDETLNVNVKKVWENTEYTTIPDEIEVALYCDSCSDGATDTVTLSAANDWSYTWYGLDASHTWAVCEGGVLTDYDVTYETQIENGEYLFVVTNTYTGEPDPTPTPTPTATPTATPSVSVTITTPPPPPLSTGDATLPQTGSNLPYVPVFAGLGTLLIVLGILLRKGGDGTCS